MKKFSITLLLLTAMALASPTMAQTDNGHSSHHPAEIQTAQTDLTDGEIRKIDKDARKITIKHGEIKILDMPPMTMVFQVKDESLLSKARIGDKIQFKVIKEGGTLVITEIQTVQ